MDNEANLLLLLAFRSWRVSNSKGEWGFSLCPWTRLGALPQTPTFGSRLPCVSTPQFF